MRQRPGGSALSRFALRGGEGGKGRGLMRNQPCKVLEAGRIINNLPWSQPAGIVGAFQVASPVKSYRLQIIASNGEGWEHVSVSIVPQKRRPLRTPTWGEMCYIKDLFWEEEELVIQYHPQKSEYINCHAYTLHLWKPIGTEIPLPPSIMVGPRAEFFEEWLK